MSQPQIIIDPDEELHIVCRLLFYNIPSFYPNAKKLYSVSEGRIFFSIAEYHKMDKTPI